MEPMMVAQENEVAKREYRETLNRAQESAKSWPDWKKNIDITANSSGSYGQHSVTSTEKER